MSKIQEVTKRNTQLATSAAVLEAGRIANKQASKLIAGQLPLMARGYADTPVGRLVIANLAGIALDHFRPDDQKLRALTNAMTVQAYQELIQTLDVDGFIEKLLEDKSIKSALAKLPDGDV